MNKREIDRSVGAWPGIRIGVALLVAALMSAGVILSAIAQSGMPESKAPQDASRIVSIGGSITEILYALNLEDRIIAVDTTSVYPPRALKEKPNVGYLRALSPEGVLGLNPSLIIAVDGAGPKETIAVIEAARVPLVRLPDDFTAEGIVDKVRKVSAAAGGGMRGRCLAMAVKRELDALAKLRAKLTDRKRVMFVLSLVGGRPMVAGINTAADGIIRLAGGVNAIKAYEGYKPVNDEAVVSAKPDVILAMNRAGFMLDAATLFAHPAFSLTPAAKARALVSFEGLYLLGFGPRTARAARELAAALYPSAGIASLPSQPNAEDCGQ